MGTVGWGYREWVGEVYPPKTPVKDYLRTYARRYRSVELNATFYRIPQIEQAEAWAAATPEDFRFGPKVTQTLSHVKPLGGDARLIEEFVTSMRGFGSRLGTVFLQLPPDFSRRRESELRDFFDAVDGRLPLAVEFRHESFFRAGALVDPVRRFFEDRGVAVVMTDTAGRRDVLHADLCAKRAFVRFRGNEDEATDLARLRDWAAKVAGWFEQGLEELYFYVHQPNNVKAPPTLEKALELFGESTGLETWPRDRREAGRDEVRPQLSLF